MTMEGRKEGRQEGMTIEGRKEGFVLSLLLIIHLLFPFSTVLLSYLLISPLYLFPIFILVLGIRFYKYYMMLTEKKI